MHDDSIDSDSFLLSTLNIFLHAIFFADPRAAEAAKSRSPKSFEWSGRRHFTNDRHNEAKMNVTVARSVLTSASRLVSGTASTASRAFSSTTAASASDKTWKVYLSGEIHSDWREVIAKGVAEKNLPVSLSSPNTSHEDSDDCGAIILGMEEERRNWDKIGANMNNLRTKTLIKDADIVVVRFGPKYRQCK